MLSQPVAAAHKEMHHAAHAAQAAPAAAPVDFSQLVDDAQTPVGGAGTTTTVVGNTAVSSTTPSSAPLHARLRHHTADATNAAAAPQLPQVLALAPPPQSAVPPQAPPATTANVQAPAVAAPAAVPALPATAGAVAQNAAGANGNANDQNGQPPPLGAADLEARIALGAPNYLSQPSSVLAGLWHHGGEPGAASPQAQSGQDQDNSAGAADPGNQAPAQTDLAAKTAAALAPAEAAAAHAAAGSDSAATAKPDADASAAATQDAATPAASFTLPGTGQVQTAATAPGANPAVPTPGHLLPAYEQVAINLKQAAQSGTDRIEIQLKPASLGAISVKLDVTHDGHITAVISADRSDTLHMLRQDSAGLQQALRDAGLQTDAGSLSFNLRSGDQQSFTQTSTPAQTASSPAEQPQAAISTSSAARPRHHDGALDIEV